MQKQEFKEALSYDDIYVVTTIGDRIDLLAWKYYANAELWWIIAAANPELRKDSLYLEPGIQLRIPQDLSTILNDFDNLNQLDEDNIITTQ